MQTDQVERDVALRLKKAGFKLMSGDFDFSISNFEKFLDVFFPGFFFRPLFMHNHFSFISWASE